MITSSEAKGIDTIDPTASRIGTRVSAVGLALILLLSLGLRLYGLGTQSVWLDEAYSLRLADLSPAGIFDETARENHPPIYFLLLSAWMRLGPSNEHWARLLSVLLGVLHVAIFYGLCRRLTSEPIALIATALLAISPMAVWHSQDARMYPLALVFSYLALWILVRYLDHPTPGQPTLFGLVSTAALFTHLYTIFLLPVSLIVVFQHRRRLRPAQFRGMVAAIILAGVCWLPWLWVIFRVPHTAGFFKPISVFSIPYALYAFSVGYSLGPSVTELRPLVSRATLPIHDLPVILSTAALFGAALLVGLANARRRLTGYATLPVLLFVVPVVCPVLVNLVSGGTIDFNARYAFLAFPAYLLLLAVGLASARPRALRVLLVAGVLSLTALSLGQHYTNPRYTKEDVRSAYRYVQSHRREGDCVLVLGVAEVFQYYERTAPTSRWLDFRYRERLGKTEATLQNWTVECPRLWFITGRGWEGDPLGLALPTVEKYFDPVERKQMPGIQIVGMRPKGRESQGQASPGAAGLP